jgi:hypothetical protein
MSRNSSLILSSSYDDDNTARALTSDNDRDAAHKLLEGVGALLQEADGQLQALDEDQVLGPALYRGSQDLAAALGDLASQLEEQSEEDQQALAAACQADLTAHALALQESDPDHMALRESPPDDLAQLPIQDFVSVLQAAAVLLRDVEASLRAVQPAEAEEVAEVALTVARLFVASLQSAFQAQVLSSPDNDLMFSRTPRSTLTIEELEDEEDESKTTQQNTTNDTTARRRQARQDRLRVLWPPLGPHVWKACHWGHSAATDQPLLAVALALVLWPAAVATALTGAPLLVMDHVAQDVYQTFQEGPILVTLERGAAQAYHSGRLAWVSGKLVGRQSWRVAQRQLDRHGGLPGVAQQCVGMAVDRITHPVATLQGVWGGLCWTKDRLCETVADWRDEEKHEVVQTLQQ